MTKLAKGPTFRKFLESPNRLNHQAVQCSILLDLAVFANPIQYPVSLLTLNRVIINSFCNSTHLNNPSVAAAPGEIRHPVSARSRSVLPPSLLPLFFATAIGRAPRRSDALLPSMVCVGALHGWDAPKRGTQCNLSHFRCTICNLFESMNLVGS